MDAGRPGILPAGEYAASLARQRVAAGALRAGMVGSVLRAGLVYRGTRDLPGSAVVGEEFPHAACREVAQQPGLDRPQGDAGRVGWVPPRPGGPQGPAVVHAGGMLPADDGDAIALPDGEPAGFAFAGAGEAAGRVTPLVAHRIVACLDAAAGGPVASPGHGIPVS